MPVREKLTSNTTLDHVELVALCLHYLTTFVILIRRKMPGSIWKQLSSSMCLQSGSTSCLRTTAKRGFLFLQHGKKNSAKSSVTKQNGPSNHLPSYDKIGHMNLDLDECFLPAATLFLKNSFGWSSSSVCVKPLCQNRSFSSSTCLQTRKITPNSKSVMSAINILGKKVDKIDAKVGEVDAKVDKIDARVNEVDAKVDKIDARVGEIDAKVVRMDAKIDELEAKVDNIEIDMIDLGIMTVKNFEYATSQRGSLIRRVSFLQDIKSALKESLGKQKYHCELLLANGNLFMRYLGEVCSQKLSHEIEMDMAGQLEVAGDVAIFTLVEVKGSESGVKKGKEQLLSCAKRLEFCVKALNEQVTCVRTKGRIYVLDSAKAIKKTTKESCDYEGIFIDIHYVI
uniref:Uncharacterized protein n=1 Tax=Ditylenchus dipsaci TaxID=166011 RepID=A0A915DE69_9BILA